MTPHIDIVALMVLEHQTQMHNAIAAANYETRMALHQSFQMNGLLDRPDGHISDSAGRRIDAVADKVMRHLLMCDEFALSDSVTGSMINSPALDGLPDEVRDKILSRLMDVLQGRDPSPDFDHLTPAMRREILEILQDTKP